MNSQIREIRPVQSYSPVTGRSNGLVAHLIGELIRRQLRDAAPRPAHAGPIFERRIERADLSKAV